MVELNLLISDESEMPNEDALWESFIYAQVDKHSASFTIKAHRKIILSSSTGELRVAAHENFLFLLAGLLEISDKENGAEHAMLEYTP